jgi:hypothetical protein
VGPPLTDCPHLAQKTARKYRQKAGILAFAFLAKVEQFLDGTNLWQH